MDHMLRERLQTLQPKKRRLGCWIVSIIVFLLVGGYGGYTTYKFFYFYQKLKTGQTVDLPQFSSKFTRRTREANATTMARRQELEQGTYPSYGAKDARLTIVEFGDFECPYSKESAAVVRSLMVKYGDRVKLVYRHFPLTDIHPNATQAAVASECANEQGKFWQFYDKLYANQNALTFADLVRYSTETGLDTTQFRACLVSNRYANKVATDAAYANAIGLQGTPTFFFNGQMIEGAIPESTYESLIQRFTK